MTIKNVFEELEYICRLSFDLLCETDFDHDEELGEEVCHLDDICEDAFVRRCASDIMSYLEQACMLLYGLKKIQYEGTDVTCSGSVPDEDDDELPWDDDDDDERLPFPLHNENRTAEGRRTP